MPERDPKTILVFGHKNFKVNVPVGAKITFGPWSPPTGEGKYAVSDKALNGTLRIYENAKAGASILAVFSGVTGFRDLSMGYAEEVAREEKVARKTDWITPRLPSGDEDAE